MGWHGWAVFHAWSQIGWEKTHPLDPPTSGLDCLKILKVPSPASRVPQLWPHAMRSWMGDTWGYNMVIDGAQDGTSAQHFGHSHEHFGAESRKLWKGWKIPSCCRGCLEDFPFWGPFCWRYWGPDGSSSALIINSKPQLPWSHFYAFLVRMNPGSWHSGDPWRPVWSIGTSLPRRTLGREVSWKCWNSQRVSHGAVSPKAAETCSWQHPDGTGQPWLWAEARRIQENSRRIGECGGLPSSELT